MSSDAPQKTQQAPAFELQKRGATAKRHSRKIKGRKTMLKQMKTNRLVALSTLAAMTLTSMGALTVTPAHAGPKGKRNLALGLGAVGVYGLVKKKRTLAIAGGVGAALAYRSYRKSAKKSERRRQAWYRQRYGRNWRTHYKRGT